MKHQDENPQKISQEEQIAKLRLIGISEDDARKIVASSQEDKWGKIYQGIQNVIPVISLVAIVGFALYISNLVNSYSSRIEDLNQRVQSLEQLLTRTPLAENKNTLAPTLTATPTLTITVTPKESLIPSETSLVSLTSEVTGKVITGIKIRSGPGTSYEYLGSITNGTIVKVMARSQDSTWYQVFDEIHGLLGWASATYIKVDSNLSSNISLTSVPNLTPTVSPTDTPAK